MVSRFMGRIRAAEYSAILGEASELDSPTGDVHVQHLAERMRTLLHLVGSMWELLERSGHSRDELVTTLRRLDPLYDVPEKRRSYATWQCAGCEAWQTADQETCQFCGQPRRHEDEGDQTP